jgi:large subunit ribosomal protein L29
VATKKFKELKNLSKDELASKARELEAGLFQARLKKTTGQLENVSSVWLMRKQLARVKTLQTLAGPAAAAAAKKADAPAKSKAKAKATKEVRK